MTGCGGGNRTDADWVVAVVAREVKVETEDFKTENAFPVDDEGVSFSFVVVVVVAAASFSILRFCFSSYSSLTLSISL